MTPSVFIWVQPVKLKFYLLGQKVRNTIKVPSTSSNRNRLRKGRRSTSPPGASCFRFLCAARTQSFPPPGTLCAAGTQSFPPPGTLWTGGTQYFQPLPSLLDWRDSVRLPPQVPRRLVGLSYFSPPATLWTGGAQFRRQPRNLGTGKHGRTCLSRNILCVYIPWRLSTGHLVRTKR